MCFRKCTFIIFCIYSLHLIFCSELNSSDGRKTYYFKFDKINNEYKLHNRIHYLNHNITDYDHNYNYNRNAKVKIEPVKVKQIVNKTTFFLDKEWSYNHTKLVKSNLPLFFTKFYESRINDTSEKSTLRLLFNNNANTTSSIIKFNLKSLNAIRDDETILDADMFIYLDISNNSSIFEKSIVMRIYQFDRQENKIYNESILITNPDVHKLFNVIYISKATKGWQAFKIKKPLDNWVHNGDINLGLIVTISSYDDNKLISVFNDTNQGILRTFAVIKILRNGTLQDNFQSENQVQMNSSQHQCYKHPIYINFETLGWSDFIVSPQSFTTFDCVGNCNKIFNYTSNHVKLLNMAQQRIACCVPVKYQSLPIMFYDEFNNIVIKIYENMIPYECTCR